MVSTLLFVRWVAHDMVPSGPCSLSRLGGQLRRRSVLDNANAIMAALSPQTLRQSLVQVVSEGWYFIIINNYCFRPYLSVLITYSRGFLITLLRAGIEPGFVCSLNIAQINPNSSRATPVTAFCRHLPRAIKVW